MGRVGILILLMASTTIGCASAGPASAPQTANGTTAQAPKTLSAVIRTEPSTLAARALQTTGVTLNVTLRMFNAGLVLVNDHDEALPYLAETVPALGTDSWLVFDDGTMETTYHLRPGLTWQDGQPITADDFVFAWQVYSNPAFGQPHAAPHGLMDAVQAPDPLTLVIHWSQAYPFAGRLDAVSTRTSFPPLPRHLLSAQLDALPTDAFIGMPFWTTEYVGAGPFRVESWQPGTAIEASAFGGHALGRPKIDRLELRVVGDANAAVSQALSGAVQLVTDDAIFFQQAALLQAQWAPIHGGGIVTTTGLWRYAQFQLSPQYNRAPALMDLRVRQALAYTLDREAVNQGVYLGQGVIADSMIPPTSDYFPVVENAITTYPYGEQRSAQLLSDAGYSKGADGVYASPQAGRLSLELKVASSAQNQTEQSIVAARWRDVGFDVSEVVLPNAQAQDGETRATFPSIWINSTPAGDSMVANQGTASIPTAANHWNGNDRGSWSNAEYDRLAATYNTTLDRDQRIQLIAQMLAVYTADLPAISMNFNPKTDAVAAALHGPAAVGPDSSIAWNVQDWELE